MMMNGQKMAAAEVAVQLPESKLVTENIGGAADAMRPFGRKAEVMNVFIEMVAYAVVDYGSIYPSSTSFHKSKEPKRERERTDSFDFSFVCGLFFFESAEGKDWVDGRNYSEDDEIKSSAEVAVQLPESKLVTENIGGAADAMRPFGRKAEVMNVFIEM
ncbi:hypothetical protein POTOM_001516 [Populus tomentosa]|uniref:Uncharacterized protein n=1 Tax=Populus tomentosa TaxID=118781 RepID=A0A8X8DI03_POPTO|nr:hypothetical protein POTOM_001516 [Populus tomentosa]